MQRLGVQRSRRNCRHRRNWRRIGHRHGRRDVELVDADLEQRGLDGRFAIDRPRRLAGGCAAASTKDSCHELGSPLGCVWQKAYPFSLGSDVCESPTSCAGIEGFELCVYDEPGSAYLGAPTIFTRSEPDRLLVMMFHSLPADDEVPGWTIFPYCEIEPTDCDWHLQ